MLIFAVAAAVAVVQATGSDAESAPPSSQASVDAPQTQSSAPSQQQVSASQVASAETESAPAAQSSQSSQPTQQEPAQQAPTEQADSASQTAQSGEAAEAVQHQAIQEQSAARPTPPSNPLQGFIVPIRDACITEFEGHLPSSPRAYRNDGVHEGLDFYQWASCTTVGYATEILAAKAGVVIRADHDYIDITPADWDRFAAANWEGEQILDELRGRQIWIDHGRGIVTRYAHLSAIADGIAAGVEVAQGQTIGYPGESGQQEVYNAPGTDIHLHFEIRISNGWLGQGEAPLAARQLYLEAFGLAASGRR